MVRELQTAISTVSDQQRSLGMAVVSSNPQLHHFPKEHRSLSDGMLRLDGAHRQEKQESDTHKDEVRQVFDLQQRRGSALGNDFRDAQIRHDEIQHQITHQMRFGTNQGHRALAHLSRKLGGGATALLSAPSTAPSPQFPQGGFPAAGRHRQ